MQSTITYESPLGRILLAGDETGLTGLWFEGQKYYARGLAPDHEEKELPVLREASRWLDMYFAKKEPDFMPTLHLVGTPFQKGVWELLLKIPYGKLTTYGQLSGEMAKAMGRDHMSAQAVGSAVGRNPISIIVPCHRVVGTNGSLTGYAGGLDKKVSLLEGEGVDMEGLFVPARGTAL